MVLLDDPKYIEGGNDTLFFEFMFRVNKIARIPTRLKERPD